MRLERRQRPRSLRRKDKENEHTLEKARLAQAELALAEKNQELLGRIEDAHKQGARERAENLADAALPEKMLLYWTIATVLVVAFLFVGVVLIMKIVKGELSWLPEAYEKASVVIDVFAEVLIGVVGFVIISKGLCGLDKNEVRERLIRKYSK